MKARNKIKSLLDGLGVTRYEFWQRTRLSQNTAYRLYDDSTYIPGSSVIEKINDGYHWQPGDYLVCVDVKSDDSTSKTPVVA